MAPVASPQRRHAWGRSGFALAALCLAAGAPAQNLQELYDQARGYDAAYQSARAQAESTIFRAEQARALKRPAINAVGTIAESRSDTPYSTTLTTRSSQQQLSLNAQQSLFNRPNDDAISQAEANIEIGRAQLLAAEQDLIVRLAQAYFDALSAADTLATVRANKAAISEQLASAKRNFEVGTATITDTREAQARHDLAAAQELAAENDLNVKQLALDSVVGRSRILPRPLATPVVLPPTAPADVETWVGQGDAASPALVQLRLAREIARLETAKARAGHLPTVGVNASLSDSYTTARGTMQGPGGATTPFGPLSGPGPAASIALQVNLPIFSGFSVENRIKETLQLEEKAQQDLEAGRRNTAQATRSAFFNVQSLRAQVAALEAAEASSKLALEATVLGYKVGVRVNIDVLNAQAQLYQAQHDLDQARYNVILNGLKLRQVTGLLSAQDVTAVNALLAR